MSNGEETKSEEELKTIPLLHPWKIFFWEAFLFSLTLGLGIVAASRINEILKIQKIGIHQIPFWKFVISFLFATLFILLLIRFSKFEPGRLIIFKFLFTLTVLLGGLLFLEAWFSEPIPFFILFLLIFWWLKKPSVLNQDILMILGMAGVGSTLGLALQPIIVVALLIIFSIYDFIAVYKTKHMVKMAKEMIESRAILALIIPKNILGFRESLEKIEPGGKFLILGGGDVIFPLLFSASLVPVSILNSLIVAIFSLVGLFIGFYIFTRQKIRQPIPALPPIAFFSIFGFLITLIFC